MEKKFLSMGMSALVMVVVLGGVGAAREAGEQEDLEKQVRLRVENQKGRLVDIEEVVLREQRRIEEEYVDSLDELRRAARRRASRFEGAIRMVWAEFIRESAGAPYADGYFSRTHINFLDDRGVYGMRGALWERYSLVELGDFLMDESARELLKAVLSDEMLEVIYKDKPLGVKKRELLSVIREIELQAAVIENRREAGLANLEQWRKFREEDVFGVIEQINAELDKPEVQVVEAVGHGIAMVGGEIVYEGDIKDKVRVIRIFGKGIEFERGGRRWARKAGEAVD